jgi:endonuclease/exonuclease/phosphatase family metal-dependent hydrolase
MSKVLALCAKNRLPDIRACVKQAKENVAIIAGDFNEPSHLDLKMLLPVSRAMAKYGFTDVYRAMNKTPGYTWPAAGFYKREPPQRVDYIYTRGFKVASSNILDASGDHKLVWAILSI